MTNPSSQPIFIFKVRTRLAQNGEEIEKEQLTVQGKNLVECRKHFDELWGKQE